MKKHIEAERLTWLEPKGLGKSTGKERADGVCVYLIGLSNLHL